MILTKGSNKKFGFKACVLMASEGRADGHILGIIRSIGIHNVPVYVIIVGKDTYSAAVYSKSRFCKGAFSLSSDDSSKKICDQFLSWVQSKHFGAKPILMPLTDSVCTLVSEFRPVLEEAFDVCMPANDIAMTMLDKAVANDKACNEGLLVPQAATINTTQGLRDLAGRMNFPLVVKPSWWKKRGNEYFKAIICETEDSFLKVSEKAIANGAEIVVQEYIPGGDETIEVYMFYRSKNGKTIHGCTGNKIRQLPPGAGSMASGKAEWLTHVAEISNDFLNKIDYRGFGGIEYKRYKDKSYFIEMSIRPEGFHQLSIKAGVDLPWLAYQDMALNSMPINEIRQRNAYYIKGLAYISLWRRYRRVIPVFRELLRLLLKNNTVLNLWSWRDPIPFFAVLFFETKKAMLKVFKK